MDDVSVKGHAETAGAGEVSLTEFETDGSIVLRIGPGGGNGEGLELNTWKSYSFGQNFLTPTDGWSFTIGDEVVTDELRIAIAPRQRVTLSIGGDVQCAGIVDKVITNTTRSGGLEFTVEGRDVLSSAVDSVIDPRITFKPEMKLLDLLRKVFEPFGFSKESQFLISNEDNLNVMMGKKHKTTKAGQTNNEDFHKTQAEEVKAANAPKKARKTKVKVKPLSDFDLHLLKPEQHETAFTFASRVAARFGLVIWPHADGEHLIIGKPDFDKEADYRVTHRRGGAGEGIRNNVISASCTRDGGSQPSVIFATGFGTGGENPRDQFTLCVVNPMIQTDTTAIFAAYPKTKPLDLSFLGDQYSGNGKETPVYNATGGAYVDTFARPLFLHDENSKTIEELESFLKRELALRMHKAFTYTFEVLGHEYAALDGAKVPWAVDTIVNVHDDLNDVHEDLWILERTFTKSRAGGTMTKLVCIRPHTLEF